MSELLRCIPLDPFSDFTERTLEDTFPQRAIQNIAPRKMIIPPPALAETQVRKNEVAQLRFRARAGHI